MKSILSLSDLSFWALLISISLWGDILGEQVYIDS
jgi:hypothetical protein